MMVWGCLNSGEKGGHQELGEIPVAEDVGAPLEIVAIIGEEILGRPHDTAMKSKIIIFEAR